MTRTRLSRALPALLLCATIAAMVAGCHRDAPDDAAADDVAAAAGTLPKPEAGAGSVTGLPGARAGDAGNGAIAAPGDEGFDLGAVDEDGNPIPDDAVDASAPGGEAIDAGDMADLPAPPDAATPPPAQAPGEPGADEAAAVVRKYYGAIDARQYGQAYRLWSGDGRSSGQSEASFAGGFEDTAGVTVQTGEPGRVEPAAGSRYVRVPVTIRAVQVDGSERRYEGSYTLRRSVVDGATDAQREWRIESADLREVQ